MCLLVKMMEFVTLAARIMVSHVVFKVPFVVVIFVADQLRELGV